MHTLESVLVKLAVNGATCRILTQLVQRSPKTSNQSISMDIRQLKKSMHVGWACQTDFVKSSCQTLLTEVFWMICCLFLVLFLNSFKSVFIEKKSYCGKEKRWNMEHNLLYMHIYWSDDCCMSYGNFVPVIPVRAVIKPFFYLKIFYFFICASIKQQKTAIKYIQSICAACFKEKCAHLLTRSSGDQNNSSYYHKIIISCKWRN